MDARTPSSPSPPPSPSREWPEPRSLVAPFLWSVALFVVWCLGMVGLAVLGVATLLNDPGSQTGEDWAWITATAILGIGLLVLMVLVAVAWIKGRASAAVRGRFLRYATIALVAAAALSLLAFFLLPDGRT